MSSWRALIGGLINSRAPIIGTLTGAVCFLVGAILTFAAWKHAVRAANLSVLKTLGTRQPLDHQLSWHLQKEKQ